MISTILITFHHDHGSDDHHAIYTYDDHDGDEDEDDNDDNDDDDLSIVDPNLGMAKPISVNVAQITNMTHLEYIITNIIISHHINSSHLKNLEESFNYH